MTEKISLSDKSIDFLIADFQACVSQWQHMNDRMDKEIQYYFTLLGVGFTGIALLFQISSTPSTTLAVVQVLIVVIIIAGFRLLRRLIHLTGQSALFSSQIGLIRSGFIDMDLRLSSYVMMTMASFDKSAHDFTPVSKQLSVRLLSVANTLFAMVVVVLVPVYFYQSNPVAFTQEFWIILFVAFVVIAAILGGVLLKYQRRLSVTRGDKYLDALTQTAQQRRRTIDTH
jgi:hypothetical protein